MWRPSPWRDWPWASKLAVLLAALAVVPLAVVALYHDAVTRNELLAATRAQNLQQARNTAAAIDRHLAGVLADLRVLAASPLAVRFLSTPGDPALAADAALALRQAATLQGFQAISLTDRGGDILLSSRAALRGQSYL